MEHVIVLEPNAHAEAHVKPGDTVIAQLAENPSTGRTWRMESASSITLLRGESYESDVSAAPGAETTHRFEIAVTAEGSARLTFNLHLPGRDSRIVGTGYLDILSESSG